MEVEVSFRTTVLSSPAEKPTTLGAKFSEAQCATTLSAASSDHLSLSHGNDTCVRSHFLRASGPEDVQQASVLYPTTRLAGLTIY